MRGGRGFITGFFVVLLTVLSVQEAQAAGGIGGILDNVIASWDGLPGFLGMLSYISGLFLAVYSLFKFKDHVDNPNQTKISEGVKRMLAGGMFLALPYMTAVAYGSFMGNDAEGLTNAGWTNAAVNPEALDGMVVAFISNINEPASRLLGAFCYISGIILLMTAISRLTKRMDEGPRGPAGMGTLMTFIVAGAMFAMGGSMGAFVTSLFGDNTLMTKATIDADLGLQPGDMERIQTVIEGLLVFVTIVGYIAFIRGWFVLKAFADGQQNATVAQGLTFLFGGTLAINLGALVNALQASVNITGGITFG